MNVRFEKFDKERETTDEEWGKLFIT